MVHGEELLGKGCPGSDHSPEVEPKNLRTHPSDGAGPRPQFADYSVQRSDGPRHHWLALPAF